MVLTVIFNVAPVFRVRSLVMMTLPCVVKLSNVRCKMPLVSTVMASAYRLLSVASVPLVRVTVPVEERASSAVMVKVLPALSRVMLLRMVGASHSEALPVPEGIEMLSPVTGAIFQLPEVENRSPVPEPVQVRSVPVSPMLYFVAR